MRHRPLITMLCAVLMGATVASSARAEFSLFRRWAMPKMTPQEHKLVRCMKGAGYGPLAMKWWDLIKMAKAIPRYVTPRLAERGASGLDFPSLRGLLMQGRAVAIGEAGRAKAEAMGLALQAAELKEANPLAARSLARSSDRLHHQSLQRHDEAYAMGKAIDGLTYHRNKALKETVDRLFDTLATDPGLALRLQQHMEANSDVFRNNYGRYEVALRYLSRGRGIRLAAYATGLLALSMTALMAFDPSLIPGLEFAQQAPLDLAAMGTSVTVTGVLVTAATAMGRSQRHLAKSELQAAKTTATMDVAHEVLAGTVSSAGVARSTVQKLVGDLEAARCRLNGS